MSEHTLAGNSTLAKIMMIGAIIEKFPGFTAAQAETLHNCLKRNNKRPAHFNTFLQCAARPLCNACVHEPTMARLCARSAIHSDMRVLCPAMDESNKSIGKSTGASALDIARVAELVGRMGPSAAKFGFSAVNFSTGILERMIPKLVHRAERRVEPPHRPTPHATRTHTPPTPRHPPRNTPTPAPLWHHSRNTRTTLAPHPHHSGMRLTPRGSARAQ